MFGASQVVLVVVRGLPAKAEDIRDAGLIPGLGGSSGGGGDGSPLRYPCLESHGQGSLVGYGPWSHKESDTTELTLVT